MVTCKVRTPMQDANTNNWPKWQRMIIYKLCVVCSFCCVASVLKSVVSVSFFTGSHLNNTLFHSRFVIEQSDGSGSGGCTDFHAHKHHKHKVYQHMYSYIRQNKLHYKTCLALAAGTGFQAQTVNASGTKNAPQVDACHTIQIANNVQNCAKN